jgi:hypothetical protein
MSRIIPQMNKTNNKLPKWLDEKAIVKAGKDELAQKKDTIQKVSSREVTTVIASYICQKCSKVLKADHKDILAQANMNARAGVPEKAPVCMTCGDDLQSYDTIAKIDNEPSVRYADQTEKRVDLAKEASDSGTTSSFVDRHLQYRAVDTLSTFARKAGMLVGRARYLRSVRAQQAGQEYSTLNNFECEIEWMITPKLKRRVTATISYDPEGKFIMPKVFKTAEGKEYPFEKDVIKKLTTDVSFKNTSEPTLKKTDQIQFRKPDPSNFKAVASLNETAEENGVDNETIVGRLTSESKKKVPEVGLSKGSRKVFSEDNAFVECNSCGREFILKDDPTLRYWPSNHGESTNPGEVERFDFTTFCPKCGADQSQNEDWIEWCKYTHGDPSTTKRGSKLAKNAELGETYQAP